MISCKEAVEICNKSQYREAGWRQRYQLWVHLLFCKACARFSRRNKKLSHLCTEAEIRQLTEQEKQQLKTALEHVKRK